jgi:hypothetical protein
MVSCNVVVVKISKKIFTAIALVRLAALFSLKLFQLKSICSIASFSAKDKNISHYTLQAVSYW